MKTPHSSRQATKAFTLLEMSLVIMVLLTLISIGLFTNDKMKDWKLGRAASETLRSVYTAQRMYLAEHPVATVASLTPELILPYIPGSPAVMPTIESVDGAQLPIVVNVSPPFADAGGGVRYDKSGSITDSLWDVGQ